jgi:hypothetical protein
MGGLVNPITPTGDDAWTNDGVSIRKKLDFINALRDTKVAILRIMALYVKAANDTTDYFTMDST